MAFDEGLAERIRTALEGQRGVTEKKMFGGIAFLLEGKMFVGIAKDSLMVRVGTEHYERSLKQRHVRPMDFTGKPMAGYVFVASGGLSEDEELSSWIQLAMKFVSTLPASTSRPRAKRTTTLRRR